MNLRFVVFHAGVDTLPVYKPLMKVGREALAFTNPGARYVVLTDKETAPHLENDFEVFVSAPSGWPLMRQYVEAQRAYEAQAESGLVILAATDCVANRPMHDALAHNMAVTYRLMGKAMVNNIAYIADHDRAAWFLKRALDMMNPDLYEFWGDQEAWQDALGPRETWEPLDDRPEGIRRVTPEGRWIHLYPCRTHNYFVKRSGAFNGPARKAYLLHYKGSRKLMMVESVSWNILGRAPQGQPFPNWKAPREGAELVLPMEARRLKVIKALQKKRGVGEECGSFSLDTQDTGDKN